MGGVQLFHLLEEVVNHLTTGEGLFTEMLVRPEVHTVYLIVN